VTAIIEVLIKYLGRLFSSRLGAWLASALLAFGLSWTTQKFAIQPLLASITGAASGMGGTAAAWFGYLNVDKAITIVLSAYATKQGVLGAKAFLAKRGV
jgi:hypothetical protein